METSGGYADIAFDDMRGGDLQQMKDMEAHVAKTLFFFGDHRVLEIDIEAALEVGPGALMGAKEMMKTPDSLNRSVPGVDDHPWHVDDDQTLAVIAFLGSLPNYPLNSYTQPNSQPLLYMSGLLVRMQRMLSNHMP